METLSNSGERLRRARFLAGITTRREFEEKYRISANTLQGWEQGKNPLSEKGARRVIEAFKGEGWLCTIEWLMHGTGMPPRPYDMMNAGMNGQEITANVLEDNVREEETIYQETQFFKEKNRNSIILHVGDDAMEPYYNLGDYIAGVQIPLDRIDQYLGNAFIVELEDYMVLPRFIHAGSQAGLYNASCCNLKSKASNLNFNNVRIKSAAPIIWHRRKLTTM